MHFGVHFRACGLGRHFSVSSGGFWSRYASEAESTSATSANLDSSKAVRISAHPSIYGHSFAAFHSGSKNVHCCSSKLSY